MKLTELPTGTMTEPRRRFISWQMVTDPRWAPRPKHSYSGTVEEKVIAKRRAANKVARLSRRKNRV